MTFWLAEAGQVIGGPQPSPSVLCLSFSLHAGISTSFQELPVVEDV